MKKFVKNILSIILTASLLISAIVIVPAQNEDEMILFSDVGGHWAQSYIIKLANREIINGYNEDNTYRPENNISRAEFTKIINYAINLKDNGCTSEFSDVKEDDWYYKSVTKVAKNGAIKGFEGKFNPDEFITREDIATIIARIDINEEEYTEYAKIENEAPDKADISDYALGGINYCIEQGIITGYEDGSIAPGKFITRGEAAKVIYCYMENNNIIPMIFDKSYKPKVIESDTGINVLNLSSIQFTGEQWTDEDLIAKATINKALSAEEKPDMLFFNGDFIMIRDSLSNPSEKEHKRIDEIFAYIDSFEIPWTFIYGDEDYKFAVDKEYMIKKAQQSKFCILNPYKDNIQGFTNQIIEIRNKNKEITNLLYLIDTDSSGINSNQIKFIRDSVTRYTKEYDNFNVNIFMNTPLYEVRDMYYSGEIINGYNTYSIKTGSKNSMFDMLEYIKPFVKSINIFMDGNENEISGTYKDINLDVQSTANSSYSLLKTTAVYSNIKLADEVSNRKTQYTYGGGKLKDITYNPIIGIKKSDDLIPNKTEKRPITVSRKSQLLELFNGFIKTETEWLASLQTNNGALPMTAIPDGSTAKIVPCFSDMHAIAFTTNPKLYKNNIKKYIDWHFNNLNTAQTDPNKVDGTIFDYYITGNEDGNKQSLIKDEKGNILYYDSTDAYAALFMKVLYDYASTCGDTETIMNNVNNITRIMNAMFATLDNGLTWAKPDYKVKYCMDNLEVYRGLENVVKLYKEIIIPQYEKANDTANIKKAKEKVEFYLKKSKLIFDSIENKLWKNGFYDTQLGRLNAPLWDEYYPFAAAQIQPMAMGIIDPTCERAVNLYNEFNKHYSKDGFRWEEITINTLCANGDLGQLGAVMGDIERVETFIKAYIEKCSNTGRWWPTYNNDVALAVLACRDAINYIENNMVVVPDNTGNDNTGDANLSRNLWLDEELIQLSLEGRDINVSLFRKKIKDAGNDQIKQMQVYNEMQSVPQRADFKYSEPEKYDDIMKQVSSEGEAIMKLPDDEVIKDKMLAAWQGKIAGIALGLPVEGWNYKPIKTYLEKANAWPLKDFFPSTSPAQTEDGINLNLTYMCKGHFNSMPSDDDLNYMLLNTQLVNLYGTRFSTWTVGSHWLYGIPLRLLCTAERIAYTNFTLLDEKYYLSEKPTGEELEDIMLSNAKFANPYREWIGAQIRADALGMSAAGNPRLAARMGFYDAALSHTKNGAYAEMYYAALMSAAFASDNVYDMLQRALLEIPQNTRLYEAVKFGIETGKNAKTFEEMAEKLNAKFAAYNVIHALPNAAACAAAIAYSKGNSNLGLETAVMLGYDADCNGATVAAILGALNGTNSPNSLNYEIYVKPFNNTLVHNISGLPGKVTELAQFSFDVFNKYR